MVRWVVCACWAGVACSMPNPLFQVDDASSGASTAIAGPESSGASASSSESSESQGSSSGALEGTLGVSGSTSDAAETTAASTGDSSGADSTSTGADPSSTGEPVCAGVCGTPGCGDCPGGDEMVTFPGFEISAREVFNAQYQQFLDAAVDPATQGPACLWNHDFTPSVWPVGDGGLPVVNVDWCDAHAYCRWAGKRLCGSISGGPSPIGDAFKPALDQWYHACSDGGARKYPYGDSYEPQACNGEDAGLGEVVSVGALSGCEGPESGLFDLSGNVWELVDSCTGDSGPKDLCLRRGGSFHSDKNELRCDLKSTRPRDASFDYVGFRCCGL